MDKISFQEYLHNREHVPMGCGPMDTCTVCAMGETPEAPAAQAPLIAGREITKYLLLASFGTVFLELVLKPALKKYR